MIQKIRTYLNEGAIYYGMEVSEQAGKVTFLLLEIQRKKEEFFITNTHTFTDLDQCGAVIKKNAPLFLAINTSNVLTKIVDASGNDPNEAMVHQAFPNLDFDNFYYEVAPMEGKTLISISKRSHIHAIIEDLKTLNIHVADFSLGISAIKTVKTYLNGNILYLSNTKVTLKGNTIDQTFPLSGEEEHLIFSNEISGLEVPNKGTLGFASVLKYVSKDYNTVNFDALTLAQEKEFRNKRHIAILLKTSLIAILGILLINFLIFNHYFQKVEALKTTSEVNSTNKDRLTELKTIVEQKEERVNTILSATNSKVSFYMDELAKSIPSNILLEAIRYQPLKKPMRPSKPIELEQRTIIISGSTDDGKVFSSWLEALESMDWIITAETLDYDYGSTNSSNFSIKITIDDE